METSGPANVLLVTLDTTRADRLGCYGYRQAMTPTLDRLAAAGVRFEWAYSPVPLTLPAHTSLLTGTYPIVHGLRINQAGSLGDEIETLAERFKLHGFRTGAFVSAWVLDSTFGLDHGFDHYADNLTGEKEMAIPVSQTGDRTCDAALAWLAERPDEPFFAWVHFFDPHTPYSPPAPYGEQLADPYDGEIAFVDGQLHRLIDWLEGSDLLDDTLVVVAGDHGEALSEHEEETHGFFIYESTMRVPLILTYTAALPAGEVVTTHVGLIDVFPTVMELMGWEAPYGIDGRSLVASWTSDEFTHQPVYSESEYAHLAYGWAPLSSLTTEKWKYIEAPKPELYDRSAVREETNNIVTLRPEVASRIRQQLRDMREMMVPRTVGSLNLDAAAQRRLESLGYVGAGGAGFDEDNIGRDPKDMLDVYLAHSKSMELLDRTHMIEALKALEPIARDHPDSDAIQGTLGQIYLGLNRMDKAEKAFKAGLRKQPGNHLRRFGLAETLRRRGKMDEAAENFSTVVAAMPDFGEAHRSLGLIHAAAGRVDKAYIHFRRHAELDPTSPNAHVNLGNILVHLQRPTDAVAAFRTALRYDPGNEFAHRSLWRALMAAGREGEALPALRAAHQAMPDDEQTVCMLASVLASSQVSDPGSAEERRELAERCVEMNPASPFGHDVMGRVYASAGEYDKAVQEAERALELARQQGNEALSKRIAAHLKLYRGVPDQRN